MTAPRDIFACIVGAQHNGHRICPAMPRTPSCVQERVPEHPRSALVTFSKLLKMMFMRVVLQLYMK